MSADAKKPDATNGAGHEEKSSWKKMGGIGLGIFFLFLGASYGWVFLAQNFAIGAGFLPSAMQNMSMATNQGYGFILLIKQLVIGAIVVLVIFKMTGLLKELQTLDATSQAHQKPKPAPAPATAAAPAPAAAKP